ncbi:MAG: HPr family phosphocarrier protein [Pseudomonadota bacterium]
MTAGPKKLEICNERGLHARASARFVKTCENFDAEVRVKKGEYDVGGTSIMGLMMLAASKGCSVQVSATGPQADEALAALETLVADRFGEEV